MEEHVKLYRISFVRKDRGGSSAKYIVCVNRGIKMLSRWRSYPNAKNNTPTLSVYMPFTKRIPPGILNQLSQGGESLYMDGNTYTHCYKQHTMFSVMTF